MAGKLISLRRASGWAINWVKIFKDNTIEVFLGVSRILLGSSYGVLFHH